MKPPRLPAFFKRPLPLHAPRQPGERKPYTQLQVSRLIDQIFQSQRWTRYLFAFIAFFSGLYVVNSVGTDAAQDRQGDRLEIVVARLEEQNKRLSEQAAQLASAIAAITAVRTSSRSSSCSDALAFEVAHNALVDGVIELVRAAFDASAASKPPDEAAETRRFAAQRIADLELNKVRLRDCSAAGIEAFNTNPTPPPDIQCVGDGRGYCK